MLKNPHALLQCSQKMRNISKSKWKWLDPNIWTFVWHIDYVAFNQKLMLISIFQTFERRHNWTASKWKCPNHQLYPGSDGVQWAWWCDVRKIKGTFCVFVPVIFTFGQVWRFLVFVFIGVNWIHWYIEWLALICSGHIHTFNMRARVH